MLKRDFYSKKWDFIAIFEHNKKTSKVMKTLLIFKNTEKSIIKTLYFKNEEKAFNQQNSWPCAQEWELIYLKDRGKSGHRYEIKYARFNEIGEMDSGYIICFTKKEALSLSTKILGVSPYYYIKIKKLY